LAKSTSYEATHYAVFSNLLSLHLATGPIFCQVIPVCIFPHLHFLTDKASKRKKGEQKERERMEEAK
jgi:hypothetical protein